MPVEIREIVIKATVNQNGPQGGGAAAAAGAGSDSSTGDALQECIEQVMQVLQDKKER